jgi:signal transduction histidine kinase
VRLDRDRESVVTGTGLGLTVVRELVQAQGGRCWIEEALEPGARVVVRLAKGATMP